MTEIFADNLAPLAGYLAGILSLAAFVPYVLSIFGEETKPNRASWFIWLVVSLIIALSYREAGAAYAFIMPVAYSIGATIIASLSLRYGTGGWNRFDRICLSGAGLGLAMWVMFNSPMSALVICLFMNLLGTLPTIRKAYYQPGTENRLAWALFSLGTILNLLAIEEWTVSMAFYPVAIFCIVGVVTVLVLLPSLARRNGGQGTI